MSKQLATIYKEVPTNLSFDDIKYRNYNDKLKEIYERLEFYSFLKSNMKTEEKKCEFKVINNISELDIKGDIAVYLELDNLNYHTSNILGMAIYNKDISAFIPLESTKTKS
jgi:DNA polymerase-1